MQWLKDNWPDIAVPVLTFLAACAVGTWLRAIIFKKLTYWVARSKWGGRRLIVESIRHLFLHWFLLLGAYISIEISTAPVDVKDALSKSVATIFILDLSWAVINSSEKLVRLYAPRLKATKPATAFAINAIRIEVVIICIIVLLSIWVVSVSPLLVLLAVAVLATTLAFRHRLTNIAAKIQFGLTGRIKPGNYIKLESGTAGCITKINWNTTSIKTPDKHLVFIPNSKLLSDTITIYRQELKKAKEPFHFNSRVRITELTGIRAKTLEDLLAALKEAPDATIYYHTHHFLEEHHYLTPEPSNDLSVWVSDALGDDILGERLACVDTLEFLSIDALKERLVGIIEEHISSGFSGGRKAMDGREFHFMKSVSAILPTPYVAHDLREFVEALRKISLNSLYFHVFEARIRLGKGLNDFSAWLQDSLGEAELGREVARLDPYTYNLEGLRSALIQVIEKRIK